MSTKHNRILVVDDEAGIRNSLARIMRAAGHQVCVAKDGFDAIELSKDFVPDLLLVDIRMPGIDGIETFRRLRQQQPSLVAIFMTAYSASEQSVEASERGALSVLAKPLDIDHLMALVRSALMSAPILIADDDKTLLKSIARALRASGIEVETVTTIGQAVRSLRQRPDRVVVADVFLQDGFGYELLQCVDDTADDVPFILITGHSDWIDTELADSFGGRAICLTKPIDIQKLIEQVNRR